MIADTPGPPGRADGAERPGVGRSPRPVHATTNEPQARRRLANRRRKHAAAILEAAPGSNCGDVPEGRASEELSFAHRRHSRAINSHFALRRRIHSVGRPHDKYRRHCHRCRPSRSTGDRFWILIDWALCSEWAHSRAVCPTSARG